MNSPSPPELDPKDHLEILDLISEYSRTFDSEQLEAFANLFTEDGSLDTPAGGGTDRASILAWAQARWEDNRNEGVTPRHFQTNTQLKSTGPGLVAATTQLLLVWVSSATGAAEVKFVSRYEDELQKTNEGWRIRRRSIA
jgi:hypothetical protein